MSDSEAWLALAVYPKQMGAVLFYCERSERRSWSVFSGSKHPIRISCRRISIRVSAVLSHMNLQNP